MYLLSIHHTGSSRYVYPSLPHLGEAVTIRLRTAVTPHIQQVLRRTAPDGEPHYTALHQASRGAADACQW